MHGHDLLIDSEPEANRRCVIGSHRRRRLVLDRFLKNGKIGVPTAKRKTGLADEFFAVGILFAGVFQGSVKDGGVRSILLLFVSKT